MSMDQYISLAHGNGGRYMRELIAEIFARHLSSPGTAGKLDVTLDAAPIPLDSSDEPYMTTDGFIVQPLEFPGGDIGSLAVHGTVNDLAVSGARPLYLTLNAFIEEPGNSLPGANHHQPGGSRPAGRCQRGGGRHQGPAQG
jgi:hydrogenase expression/formation protein HypE